MVILQNKKNVTHRKNKNLKKVLIVIFSALAGISVITGFSLLIKFFFLDSSEVKQMKSSWQEYDYQTVYDISKSLLQKDNLNNTLLTYNGYSAFYLAVSQHEDTLMAQNYLDESVNSLRLALQSAKSSLKPQLEYMLGKAYFYKNSASSYYYSDLAVKYLTKAKMDGYKADDISEYLGLSHAALGNTKESIENFTEALLFRETDFLLLSIAEQYTKAGQSSIAIQYLFRILKNCQNDELLFKTRILLGNIYLEDKKYTDAKNEYEEVLKLNSNSADAYYGLGLIYEAQGDLVKARSEWRKALKAQVNHQGALTKISETR